MHIVENHAGRLVEVRLASPLTMDEAKQFVSELTTLLQKIGDKYIGIVDLLNARVFPADVTAMLIQFLSGASSHVERSAMLIGASATFALQVERVIRSGNNPNRRAFRIPEEAAAWLGETLTEEEASRLDAFVHEIRIGPAARSRMRT